MSFVPEVDPIFLRFLTEQYLSHVNHKYFRAEMHGWEKLPKRKKPRIYFSNHSGMSFPWDGIVFNTLLFEKNGYSMDGFPRPLIHPMLTKNKINNPYMIPDFWHKAGCVDAHLDNFEELLKTGHDVLVYPEGAEGIGKGFNNRYQIQTFSNSFLRMAHKFDAELIPIYTINAEFLHPFAYKNERLNRFVQKLGLPFLPVSPLVPLAGIYPWMYYFSLPAKIHFIFGDPINAEDIFSDHSLDSHSRGDFIQSRNRLQSEFQSKLSNLVDTFGKDPYLLSELWESYSKDPKQLLHLLPFNWPIVITGIIREFESSKAIRELKFDLEELFSFTIKNWDAYAFTFPFSWP